MTTAEKIAAELGNDGQRWETEEGVYLASLAIRERAKITWKDEGHSDLYRYNFPDGSAIVCAESAWDLALDPGEGDCFCWQGERRHAADCPVRN